MTTINLLKPGDAVAAFAVHPGLNSRLETWRRGEVECGWKRYHGEEVAYSNGCQGGQCCEEQRWLIRWASSLKVENLCCANCGPFVDFCRSNGLQQNATLIRNVALGSFLGGGQHGSIVLDQNCYIGRNGRVVCSRDVYEDRAGEASINRDLS
jgi:hypothetical protein